MILINVIDLDGKLYIISATLYAFSQRTTLALEPLPDPEMCKAVFALGLQEYQKQVFARASKIVCKATLKLSRN